MAITTTYNFDNAANFTLSNSQISGSDGILGFVDLSSQTFTQSFDSSTGFTFNASNTEFASSLMRQIDKTPANSLFGVKYTSSVNLNWHKGGGSLTGTLNGSPTLSGGKLVCTGVQGVYYTRDTGTIETHKFKYTPNYTTTPPANINLLSIRNGTNNNDRFLLTNSPSGNTLRLTLNNSTAGVVIALATTVGPAWTPTAGVEYEFEVVIDSIAGTVRLFVDGVLHGTNSPGGWTRGVAANRFYLGANDGSYNRGEASFDDYIMFSNAQHTTTYTPGYSLTDTIYSSDTIDIPNSTYSGLGAIQSIQSLGITEVGSPRYTVEGKYWNGSAWVVSDGSYAQANSLATFNTNISSLSVVGESVISFQVVWDNSNTLSSVDAMTLTYTGQQYAVEGSFLANNSFIAQDITLVTATLNEPSGNQTVRFIADVEGVQKYWNGAAWVVSDGTSSQANTIADFNTNISTLLTINSTVKPKVVLTTTDQTVTPTITTEGFTYNFGALQPSAPGKCQIYGFVIDVNCIAISGATVTATLCRDNDQYSESSDHIVLDKIHTATTDSNGFFSMNLLRSSSYEGGPLQYALEISKIIDGKTVLMEVGGSATQIKFTVPDAASVNITDQITGQ